MIRIACKTIGLALNDKLLLSAFIDLIEPNSGTSFQLAEDDDARVVFVSEQSVEGSSWLKNMPADHFIIRLGPTLAKQGEYALTNPVRLQPLKDVLSAISIRMKHSGAAVQGLSLSDAVPAHRKLEALLRVLDQAEKAATSKHISGIHGLQLVVLPAPRQVMVRADSGTWEQALLAYQGTPQLEDKTVASHAGFMILSIDKFRWRIATLISHGMLLPGLALHTTFALRAWPDFGRLGQNPMHMRLAALFTVKPHSLSGACDATGATRDEVIGFMNACGTQRLIQDVSANLLSVDRDWRPEAQVSPSATKVEPMRRPMTRAHVTVTHGVANEASSRGFSGLLSKLRSALGIG
jgi:hypothetical protein